MKNSIRLPHPFFVLCLLLFSFCKSEIKNKDSYLLIQNATLIDVNNLGKSDNDLSNACILIKNEQIEWLGSCQNIPSAPKATTTIDATGKYIVPGLFDGFAALNRQSYCNAYLYMGITNIISVDGGRRGIFFDHCQPAPNIYRLEGVGLEPLETDSLLAQIQNYYDKGYRVMLLMYGLYPEQLKAAIQKCKDLSMATIGEMGHSTYRDGL
ncbi:MAG TPA: hypothetical protein ENJ45_06690, partial [Phaeodactylibacter sp.]|nr:hypothetical protein [Phaeodactylibacter sp.]